MCIVGPACNPSTTAEGKRGEGEKEGVIIPPAEVTSHENPPQHHYWCLQVHERNSLKKQSERNKGKIPWQRNTPLAAWAKEGKAGHEKAVYNIAGRRPFASHQAKASKAQCCEA